ncbi:short-chain dehydrogenase [Zobellella endophytica]|uniref:Short-chain dehydrogenase n=1 Tax=Zobellella endophytica TaxID=2116700 RepID=A0A2P7R6E5_9GAMM|nr:SDR family NAD(P)-dependent oxidoreductase [Zobellella endophytica]PSJ45788.1 short-chain dehydrogenase [Zobellella endophytica]
MKRVLITGASSGIGLRLALDYAADGWQVVACGRNRDKLGQALAGTGCELCLFDVRDREQARQALGELAPLDLVILNAGSCEYVDDAAAFDAALFARVIDANLIGAANCLAPLLPRMSAGSRLALVSSSVTLLPLTRAEAYGASKAGLDYLARSLAIDLAPRRIAVSLIRPGFVDTPLTRKNDFPMPGRVPVAEASLAIRRGLARGRAEIGFPSGFIWVLRLLSWLPRGLWARLAPTATRKQS